MTNRSQPPCVRFLLGLLLLTTLQACGNLTAGGFGEVDVDMSGDIDTSSPSLILSPPDDAVGPMSIARSSHGEDGPEGDIELEFQLFLLSDAGAVEQLGGLLEAEIEIDGEVEADIVRQAVPAQRYSELQMLFTSIEAEVDSGLVVGNDTITGPVEVEIENASLLVVRAIDLDVVDGSVVEIAIDLNAASWLQAVDPADGTVDASVFAGLVNVIRR